MTTTKKAIAGFFILATLSLFASVAGAQNSSPWSGNVALGYLASSGNTVPRQPKLDKIA
jgi:putative salt-induced outer membrane protein YdiY